MPSILYTALENIVWTAWQTSAELCRYGLKPWWWQVRRAVWLAWFGSSPNLAVYRHLREHAPEKVQRGGLPDDCGDLTYGEALPGAAYRLLKQMEIDSSHTVADLGCGRGIIPLTAAAAFGARSVGCDIVREYVERGQKAARYLKLQDKAEFKRLDFTSEALPAADLYFLSATCLSEDSLNKLLSRLHKAARPGCRAISVSQPLPAALWQLQMRAKVPFSWGSAVVYAYTKK
ncbi:class I SAM-dependent methyltransferase [bacterium]|nr:class I SAM-dependent methyltransferase [bacterium]